MNSISNAAEKKLQAHFQGAWYYVTGMLSNTVTTSDERYEALSADYMPLAAAKYSNLQFRSI